jgi:phosphate-selective porin OprO/OprP
MKLFVKQILFLAWALPFIGFSQETSVDWKSGLTFQSTDANFKMKIGGRIQYDHAFYSQNDALESVYGSLLTENGTKFRRAWLSNVGTLYNNLDFGLFVSFEGGKVGFRGAYMGLKKIPFLGNIRVGQLKEPLRLEVSTSSKHLLFLERSFAVDYAPIFNNGLLIYNDFLQKRLSAQFGLFRNADLNKANDLEANGGYNITQRITGLPIQKEASFLHVGGSYSFRKPSDHSLSIRSKPEAHVAETYYIDTETMKEVRHSNMVNFEALYGWNSFAVQGEYLTTQVRRLTSSSENNLRFSTYYMQASYCLTGEKRTYKNSLSGLNAVRPRKNFDGLNGYGALEVAAKYSTSDLNSQTLMGGAQKDVTLGLNWYLNPLTKVVLNQVWATIENEGKLRVFQVRFQVAF